ncbi:MAG: hypothetical protein PUP91_04035 [Rhizonema sp. PD37]|nr:hypothetical protein [Rhizonema sp. PD37]
MPTSIKSDDVQAVLNQARSRKLTPSPQDWRDHWIYFLMVDRFNNPVSVVNVQLNILFSNKTDHTVPELVKSISKAEIHEVDGTVSDGPVHVLSVNLKPMEIQILGRPIG